MELLIGIVAFVAGLAAGNAIGTQRERRWHAERMLRSMGTDLQTWRARRQAGKENQL